MPYTHVSTSRNGAEVIQYARGEGKGHNDNEVRNQLITGSNLLPDDVIPFEQQMTTYWNKSGVRSKVQTLHMYQSFSREELNPEKPEDIIRAGEIGQEFAEEMWPDHQVAIFIQTDGASGLIHAHYIVNNVNMATLKALAKEQTWHEHIKTVSDEVCSRHITLASPQAENEKIPRTVRVQREKNEQLAKEGKAPEYIWQDDLKERIVRTKETATDMDSFKRNLTMNGVELTREGKPSKNHPNGYFTYKLTDTSGFPGGVVPEKIRNLSSRSYKLGSDYDVTSVIASFGRNKTVKVAKSGTEMKKPNTEMEKKEEMPVVPVAPIQPEADIPEQGTMEWARDEAYRQTKGIFQQYHPSGTEREARAGFYEFTRWRTERGKSKDTKLPPIYLKDKASGQISVKTEELLRQYRIFESVKMREKSQESVRRQRAAMAADMSRNVAEISPTDDYQKDE